MRSWGDKGKGGTSRKVRHATSTKAWSSEEGRETTVVLTGLPKTLNAEILLDLLDEKFNCCYDYFYLPMDMDKFENTGLAYINFRERDTALQCMTDFEGMLEWKGHTSDRPCIPQWSSIQGYAANIEKQQKAIWLTSNIPEDCKPMAFDERGTRLPTLDVFPQTMADTGKDSRSWRTVHNKDEGKRWADEWYGGTASEQHEGKSGKSRGWYDSWSGRDGDWRDSRSRWNEDSSWRDWARRDDDWDEDDGAYSDTREARDSSQYDSDGWGGTKHGRWRSGHRYAEDTNGKYGEVDNYESELPDEQEENAKKDEDSLADPKGKQQEAARDQPPLESLLGMTSSQPPALLNSASGAKYACPNCSALFMKWSACQHHIVSEISCRMILRDDKLPTDLTELQDKCKAKAEEIPKDPKPSKPFADGAIKEVVRRFQ